MPLWQSRQLRKRWRYVGVFDSELMICAARVQVGIFNQSFWAAWDREGKQHFGHTSMRPGGREVTMTGPRVEIASKQLQAGLELGEVAPIETICPSGGSWGWTRKRAGMAASGSVEAAGQRWDLNGFGVDDESAGYHRRHTDWHWSAGIGRTVEGAAVAWNLVEGINDPVRDSERAIWVDGEPSEPEPVAFRGLDAIEFEDGSQLRFAKESERTRSDNMLLIRSSYRLHFGSFSGSLGGLELAEGLGVMEEHHAVW